MLRLDEAAATQLFDLLGEWLFDGEAKMVSVRPHLVRVLATPDGAR